MNILYNLTDYFYFLCFLPGLVLWFYIEPAVTYTCVAINAKSDLFDSLAEDAEHMIIAVTSGMFWLLCAKSFTL